jgi:hypothetical protein
MRGFLFGLMEIVVMFGVLTLGVSAAPTASATESVGPYEGTFEGIAHGDRDSSATLLLELTHRGDQVEGNVSLGDGLYVNGGLCSTVTLPATELAVEGWTVRGKPERLEASPTFDVGGFELTVDFVSHMSADGEVITAEARVDLPWFCGRDPAFHGILHRDVVDPGTSPPRSVPGPWRY